MRCGTALALANSMVTAEQAAPTSIVSRQAVSVLGLFLVAQVFDGVLTYRGVSTLGVAAEANLLLATAIEAIGAARALVSAKLLASACGYILFCGGFHRLLAVATGLYFGVAVLPWLTIIPLLPTGQ
jgi:hypothetical protein